jgi:hypothetical protein
VAAIIERTGLFSYGSIEYKISQGPPLLQIRKVVNQVLKGLEAVFAR